MALLANGYRDTLGTVHLRFLVSDCDSGSQVDGWGE